MILVLPVIGALRVKRRTRSARRLKHVGLKKKLHARRRVRKPTSELCDAELLAPCINAGSRHRPSCPRTGGPRRLMRKAPLLYEAGKWSEGAYRRPTPSGKPMSKRYSGLCVLPSSHPMPNAISAAVMGCSLMSRSALDRGVRPDKFVAKSWPDDRGAPLILRGSVEPLTRDDAARRWGRCRDSPFTKREFGSFAGVLRPKVRDRYADESDALGRREDGPDQAKGDLVQPVTGFNARFH